MRSSFLSLSLAVCLLISVSAWGNTTESIGIIKSVSGNVFLTNTSSSIKAAANMRLTQGDSIRTGANSNAGLILEDDTVVSLGSNSELSIVQFLFDPAAERLAFCIRLFQGTFSFISGQIAKLAPDQVKIETPDATLGVRGTKFLVKID